MKTELHETEPVPAGPHRGLVHVITTPLTVIIYRIILSIIFLINPSQEASHGYPNSTHDVHAPS